MTIRVIDDSLKCEVAVMDGDHRKTMKKRGPTRAHITLGTLCSHCEGPGVDAQRNRKASTHTGLQEED